MQYGDHPMVVDPPDDRVPWIHEGHSDKHHAVVERKRKIDADALAHMQALLQGQEEVVHESYVPTTTHLDKLPQWYTVPEGGARTENGAVQPFKNHYSWRGASKTRQRRGERPIIDHLHRGDMLPEKSTEEIWSAIYASRDAVNDRIHDRVC